MEYSDYIIYVDESGDHSLVSINKDYPLFILVFCIFEKSKYSKSAVLKLKEFKFKHFGHDMIILHENDIRRDKGVFKGLNSREIKDKFLDELTNIIEEEDSTIIATVIQKDKLYSTKNNPYHIALKYCMERTYKFLESKKQEDKIAHIVVEQRGKREDEELQLEFKSIKDGSNYQNKKFNFEIIMSNKMSNSAGLQFADLIARPIGLYILKPKQSNRAYDVIKKKFNHKEGSYKGIGLKLFPQ